MSEQRITLAYAGALHHDGQLVHAYYQLDDRGVERGEASLYPQPLSEHAVGSVCSFRAHDGGRKVLHDGVKFLRMTNDSRALAEWTTRHVATMTSERAWQLPMAEAFSCVAPIREAYRRLDQERRGVLVGQLVRYLESLD